ncbi:hypothetical protein Acsp05_11810 [Actinokineospora sp. NBRC 105648]|nr:hypothetical protein Acsp05_11810 [Actinokineospora sp. NBRC 105648]
MADWPIVVFVLGGVLALPFYKAADVRAKFIGDHPLPVDGTLTLLLVALAVSVFSVLRRSHVWADPARLTWDDTGDRDRPITRRLLGALAVRAAVVGYLFAAGGVVLGWPDLVLSVALVLAAGVFAYRRAARPAHPAELAAPFLLVAASIAPQWTAWLVVGVLAAAAIPGRGLLARRDELVRGWNAKVLRSVSAAFGDVLALLPAARPVRLRLTSTARLVLAGVAARRSALPSALLIALVVPLLHRLFPVVDPGWLTGVGGYLVLVPLAGGLSEVVRVAGLRRWVPASTRALKLTTTGVLTAVGLAWVALTVLFGLPVAPRVESLTALLAAWAAVRTATRPDIDYASAVAVDAGGLYVPVGLARQLVRGPDLLLFGLLVLNAYFHSS